MQTLDTLEDIDPTNISTQDGVDLVFTAAAYWQLHKAVLKHEGPGALMQNVASIEKIRKNSIVLVTGLFPKEDCYWGA